MLKLAIALQQMAVDDSQLDATMLALTEAVRCRLQVKERESFTEARSGLDTTALGQQPTQRHEALHEQSDTDASFQS